MNSETYQTELLQILRAHSEQAVERFKAIDEALPNTASGIDIVIHPSQDADGMFAVVVHLDGPDLYNLNKAIEGYRTLFEVRYVKYQLTPQVPMFDPFDLKFEVNDVIVDTTIAWLEEIWASFGGTSRGLTTSAIGEDDYGTRSPKKLSA